MWSYPSSSAAVSSWTFDVVTPSIILAGEGHGAKPTPFGPCRPAPDHDNGFRIFRRNRRRPAGKWDAHGDADPRGGGQLPEREAAVLPADGAGAGGPAEPGPAQPVGRPAGAGGAGRGVDPVGRVPAGGGGRVPDR